MKKFEIYAYTREEAKEKAQELGITVIADVTQSWKKKKSPSSDKEMYNFAVDMMDKKHITKAEGVGLMITFEPGSADTRERPYKIENVKNEGKRSMKRVIEIRSEKTGELLGEAGKKSDAEKLAKELMIEHREDMIATIVYRVTENKDIAFKAKYTPSASAKEGKYIVFGNERSSF